MSYIGRAVFCTLLIILSSVAFADNAETLQELCRRDLHTRIRDELAAKPYLEGTNASWDTTGERHNLTATVEIRTSKDQSWVELALYGFPYQKNGEDYIRYKPWSAGPKNVGQNNRRLLEMPIEEIYKRGAGEAFYQNFNLADYTYLLVPTSYSQFEFHFLLYDSHDDNMVTLKDKEGRKFQYSKYEIFKWNILFRGRSDLEFVRSFFDNGGRGRIVLADSWDLDPDNRGVYILPKKLPKRDSKFWSSVTTYDLIHSKIEKEGTRFVFFSPRWASVGLHLPEENPIIKAISERLGIPAEHAMGVTPNTSEEIIAHEGQHYNDHKIKFGNELGKYLERVNQAVNFENLGLTQDLANLLYNILIEQRGYARGLLQITGLYANNQSFIEPGRLVQKRIRASDYFAQRKQEIVDTYVDAYIKPLIPFLTHFKATYPPQYEDMKKLFVRLQIQEPNLDLEKLMP